MKVTSGVEPVRTCIGGRVRAAKSQLLRIVAIEGAVFPDPRGVSRGRGAYLHCDAECLALAERRRVFPRAFRLPGPLDTTLLRECVAEHNQQRRSGTTP